MVGAPGAQSVSPIAGSVDRNQTGLLTLSTANTMANGQPFFVQLAKQVAATEGGG